MIKTDIFKRLNTRDYIKIFSPVITGIFIYLLLSSFIQDFVYKLFGKNLMYSPPIPEFSINIPEISTIDIKLLASSLKVIPYSTISKHTEKEVKQPPPEYKISFIYIGKNRYVIINNKLYKEGDVLPSGEKLVRITRDKIFLRGKWGERWIKFLEY